MSPISLAGRRWRGGSCGINSAASPSNARPAPNVDVSKIYGRIQFVDAFPDYTVEVVTAFPDLRVQKVQAFPDAAGSADLPGRHCRVDDPD